MKSIVYSNRILLLTAIQMIFFCSSSFAAETVINQRFFPDYSLLDSAESLTMAANTGGLKSHATVQTTVSSGSDLELWHKYLGYGTVLMAGVTAASSSNEDFHETAAYVTVAGALSTLLTGYVAHGEQFDMSEGIFSEPNRHILLATLGAVLMTTAVVIADGGEESTHSGLGISGGVLMTLGVIDIKW